MNEKETPQNSAKETPQTQADQEALLVSDEELAGWNEGAKRPDTAENVDAAARLIELEKIENTLVLEEKPLDTPVTEGAPTPQKRATERQAPTPSRSNRAIVAGSAVTAAVATGLIINTLEKTDAAPEFSHETTTYILQEGDGLQDAARAIKGSEAIDLRDAVHRIEVDPANIEALRGGLDPGEQIVIPVSVTSKN